jgi:hypothetical protein
LLYVNLTASSRSEVREFVQLYLSMSSADTVNTVGYVSLPAAALTVQYSRFENGVTGSALGGHGSVTDIVYGWFNTDEEEKARAQLFH